MARRRGSKTQLENRKKIVMFKILSKVKRRIYADINQYRNFISASTKQKDLLLPTTLNLMVTDMCNSRCLMCNIWKKKQTEKEFTPMELTEILRDPLFNNLKYIGVSGGEPTVRKDLPDMFRAITRKKGIRGISIITNALIADIVINQIEKCYHICKEARVSFSVMISLDGKGKTHDLVRGRDGSFENALKVIRYLRDRTKIPLSLACTVVKENVWQLDEVLDFCREEKVYCRFRIAEFINRLYNADIKNSIRNFNNDEKYQIAVFFSKLELTYEDNPSVRATYKNIRQMIFDGLPRESVCPYRSVAIGLDSIGNLIFCSPKSPILGSCLNISALKLYERSLSIRQDIIKKHCDSCIHDYHSAPTKSILEEAKETAQCSAMFAVKKVLKESRKIPSAEPQEYNWSYFTNPLIIGWYGTETAGDKAILGSIIKKLHDANSNSRINIASLFPFVTKRTLHELNVNATIVKTYSMEYLKACKSADVLIVGGGPLMGIESLGFVLKALLKAKQFNIPTIVEGCGIGPLLKREHISAVQEILRLSNSIKVRDMASLSWVLEKTGRNDVVCSGDPAISFVRHWKQENTPCRITSKENHIACFLREITSEYANGLNPGDFIKFKKYFEDELGNMIIYLVEKTGLKPLFMPMHNFAIGMDDRDYARRFANTYLKRYEKELGQKIYSPQDILAIMNKSNFNLCMRFHSVLFADTIGAPFIAIDYTGGGKIKGYLEDRQKAKLIIDRIDLAEGHWKKTVDDAILREIR